MSETEKLIELVKERPFLYDMNDPEYKNRPRRMATWKEIAGEMGSGNGEIWSAKWKGLKDNYAKFKKSTEPPYDENYKKYKHWPWSEHVRFLDDCNFTSSRRIRCTPRASNNIAELYIPDANTEESNDAEPEESEIRKRKRRNTDPSDDEDSHKSKKNNIPTPDGIDQFFLSYAQAFKKLPHRMQIMLKLEIATLFTRYELQADGVAPESVDNITRIVPRPVKYELEFFNSLDD